jgi:hypothetical protein
MSSRSNFHYSCVYADKQTVSWPEGSLRSCLLLVIFVCCRPISSDVYICVEHALCNDGKKLYTLSLHWSFVHQKISYVNDLWIAQYTYIHIYSICMFWLTSVLRKIKKLEILCYAAMISRYNFRICDLIHEGKILHRHEFWTNFSALWTFTNQHM